MDVYINFSDAPILPPKVAEFEPPLAANEVARMQQPALVGSVAPRAGRTRPILCQNDLPVDPETGEFCSHVVYVEPELIEPHTFPINVPLVLCQACAAIREYAD